MSRKFTVVAGSAGVLLLFSALSAVSVAAVPGDDGVPFPNGLRDWFFVNSLTAPAESALFGHVSGMHHIYVNSTGLPTLKGGGPLPFPDGTVFADDVHEFSVKDGASIEGVKTFVTVMVKDSSKYAATHCCPRRDGVVLRSAESRGLESRRSGFSG